MSEHTTYTVYHSDGKLSIDSPNVAESYSRLGLRVTAETRKV